MGAACAVALVGVGSVDAVASAPLPDSAEGHALLNGVSTLSPTDAWAVGYTAAYLPDGLILHWDGVRWSRQLVQDPGERHEESFQSVSASSSSDVWAVGGRYDGDGGHAVALSEHWDGSTWTAIPVPRPHGAATFSLSSVASLASGEAWAVGEYDPTGNGDSLPLVVHWDGVRWNIATVPHPHLPRLTRLAAISAYGPDDVWAAGDTRSCCHRVSTTYVLHWDGNTWTRSVTPSHRGEINNLTSISSAGGTVWAVGWKTDHDASLPFVEQYAHGTWQEVALPDRDRLLSTNSVSAISARHAWIAGSDHAGLTKTAILRWNGHTWRRVTSPDPNDQDSLVGISAAGPHQIWAVGTTYKKYAPSALTELWDGHAWIVH